MILDFLRGCCCVRSSAFSMGGVGERSLTFSVGCVGMCSRFFSAGGVGVCLVLFGDCRSPGTKGNSFVGSGVDESSGSSSTDRPECRGFFCKLIERSVHYPSPTPRLRMPPHLRCLRQASAVSIMPLADQSSYCPRQKIADFGTEALLPRPSEALWEKTGPIGSPRPLVGRLPAFPVSRLVFFLIR